MAAEVERDRADRAERKLKQMRQEKVNAVLILVSIDIELFC